MPQTHVVALTDDDLHVLNAALVQMPYGQVAPLIASINQQLAAERQAEADALNEQRNRNRDATNALPPIAADDLPTS